MELRLNHRSLEIEPFEAAVKVKKRIFDGFIVSFRILGGTDKELSEFFEHLDDLIGMEMSRMADEDDLSRAQRLSYEDVGNLTRRVVHGLNMVTSAEMRWLFSPESDQPSDASTKRKHGLYIKEDSRDEEAIGEELPQEGKADST